MYIIFVNLFALPHLQIDFRNRFVGLLAKGNINRPKREILDVVEERCATRMMVRLVYISMMHVNLCKTIIQVCSGVTMAVNLYKAVQLFPGASTQMHLFTQHNLRVNGPLFSNPAEGPPNLLLATNEMGQPVIIKMLAGVVPLKTPQGTQKLGGSEGAAVRCAMFYPFCILAMPCHDNPPLPHSFTGSCTMISPSTCRWWQPA
jgi:hypothetical protein